MTYKEKLSLVGRSALITGAGQGIGQACAEALAENGAHVICTDLEKDRAEKTKQGIQQSRYSAEAHKLDVTDSSEILDLSERLKPIDILVCNAGIVSNTPAHEMSDEEWLRVVDVNLTGVFKTCRSFGKRMVKAGRGSIINIGSMSAQIVNTPQPQCHYNASKAGVHHLTKSLAVEWAKSGVRVNAVAPTYIETPLIENLKGQSDLVDRWIDLTPIGRLGRPDEVASVVQFLASDAASLITGSIINADGGYTCI